MVEITCSQCSKSFFVYKCRASTALFCNKSCHRTYKNTLSNPSVNRNLAGKNNPMYGKHPIAWNKGVRGEKSHNWRGGVHTRKDGYVRINIDGDRVLLHRHLLRDKLDGAKVVHHKDHNPSNNDLSNLEVLDSQATHARLHAELRYS